METRRRFSCDAHGSKALVAAALMLLLAGCGGSSGGSSSSSSSGGSSSSGSSSSSSSGAGSSSSSSSSSSGSSSSSSSGSSGSSSVNVLTYHNDIARTGQNLDETILTPAKVKSASFGKLGFLTTQGKVDAQPLYVSKLSIGGASHNVVYAVSEHGMAYAFDADTFAPLWQVSLLGAGETPSDDHGCGQITPEIGITATPAIDPAAGAHGAIYMVAMSKDSSGGYHQRLHALDLASGAELSGSPASIQAVYPSKAGQVTFDPGRYAERAGLLLLNGTLYLSWTSHCDQQTYTGWVMGYNPSTLHQVSVIDITPNGNEGAIWMAGNGPAADEAGNIYFLSANGTFDPVLDNKGFPVNGDFGNAFVKLSTSGGTLAVADYFTMHDTVAESNADQDLGSGGLLLLPDVKDSGGVTRHLAIGAGKDAAIYVINRDAMGKFNAANDNAAYQITHGLSGGSFSTPAYFNGTLYYGAVGDSLRAFPITSAKVAATAASNSTNSFGYPGATPSISANGSANGIVWAVENRSGGLLHAYDATDLSRELYNSAQAGNRDQFSNNKFITPMIANGKVYVGTPTGVIVFGLLP